MLKFSSCRTEPPFKSMYFSNYKIMHVHGRKFENYQANEENSYP